MQLQHWVNFKIRIKKRKTRAFLQNSAKAVCLCVWLVLALLLARCRSATQRYSAVQRSCKYEFCCDTDKGETAMRVHTPNDIDKYGARCLRPRRRGRNVRNQSFDSCSNNWLVVWLLHKYYVADYTRSVNTKKKRKRNTDTEWQIEYPSALSVGMLCDPAVCWHAFRSMLRR